LFTKDQKKQETTVKRNLNDKLQVSNGEIHFTRDGQGTKWRRNIAENFNRLSRVRANVTDDRRQTDGRRHIANVNDAKLMVVNTLRKAPSRTVHTRGEDSGFRVEWGSR